MKKTPTILITLFTISLLTCCSSYDKVLKSSDYDAKFEAAMKYYNEQRWSRARQLFENLTLYYRGTEHSEDIAWYYGQSLLKSTYYYSAAYQFKTFYKRYPYSERAQDAAFLSAYCKYMDSPSYTLDQSSTKEAIAELEQFADRYPNSPHIPEANAYLDELRGKMMQKDFEIAIGYYNTESYRAAVVALNNFLNNYPDSPKREEAMYTIIKASFEYAINSREDKMKERLQQVVNNFDKFAATFTNSKYTSDCQNIYTRCKAELAKLN